MEPFLLQRSAGGVPPLSPSMAGAGSGQSFLSISVTDPVKLGSGVQAYISYRVSTKVCECVCVCFSLSLSNQCLQHLPAVLVSNLMFSPYESLFYVLLVSFELFSSKLGYEAPMKTAVHSLYLPWIRVSALNLSGVLN